MFSALALLTISCGKTTEKIGDGLLSESDFIGVHYTDTLQILCHSEIIDSLTTKNLGTLMLGSMMDPVMGLTDASFATQLHLSSTNQRFGQQVVIDSVVLQLGFSGYYGDTTTVQTVHVYELDDSLRPSNKYYQNSVIATKTVDLANGYQFSPKPYTNYDTLTYSVVRIPLSNDFGMHLATIDSTAYDASDAFKEHCFGLLVNCESVAQDGAICYFSPTSNEVTRLIIYYRESPGASQMKYYFYITSEDIYFNQYLHDYSLGSADFTQQVIDGNADMGQDQLYFQSLGGVRSVLSFPTLMHLTDSLEPNTHILINEAKLIFPAFDTVSDAGVFKAPTSLALLNINNDGSTALLQDYYEGSSYFDGTYSSTNKNVTFRIGEHLQRILMGKQDSQGLYVSITGASLNAQRWIVAGPNADNGLRCEIKYSIVRE